ncbi:FAD-dependent thymidylate synthase [Candidatus Bathyarchaeota archaeon]|nr:FAD-dependent thymidylate synthase [Candidatus Bathyarchaeota archaeon]
MKAKLLSYIPRSTIQSYKLDWKNQLPHLSYTFAIESISRTCSHQLVRHRVASFSQQSQRYITVKRLSEKIVIPPTIKDVNIVNEFIKSSSNTYEQLVEKGVPKEDARFFLPNATETSLLMTMDGKSLAHFFGLRCCNRAQWEIRSLANSMLEQVRKVEPEIFNRIGPYCYQLGYCPEGRFSCGEMQETIERYVRDNESTS